MPFADALSLWQTALAGSLAAYLDGSCLRVRSRWTFPLTWALAPGLVAGVITRLANASYQLAGQIGDAQTGKFLSHLDRAFALLPEQPDDALASVLVEGYNLLDSLCDTDAGPRTSTNLPPGTPFDPDEYLARDRDYFAPVARLANLVSAEMQPYLTTALIHGSIGDLNYARGYSDLDTLFVVNRDTVGSVAHLKQFARVYYRTLPFLYRFDPLQHHNHMVITALDLRNYLEGWLPVVTFADAKFMIAPAAGTPLCIGDSTALVRQAFEADVDYFRFFRAHPGGPRGAHQTKEFLSILMLLPTRYLQAQGIFCAKRESFKLARQRLSSDAWEVMDYATEQRARWPAVRSRTARLLRTASGSANPQLVRQLYARYANSQLRGPWASVPERWINQAAVLATDMFAGVYGGEEQTWLAKSRQARWPEHKRPCVLPQVVNYPPAASMSQYDGARSSYLNQVAGVSGLAAVYEYGSVSVPGLSDLDFVILLGDTVNSKDVRQLSINAAPLRYRDLILHDPLIVPAGLAASLGEHLDAGRLRPLWSSGSHQVISPQPLDPQTSFYVQAARLVEKLFSYRVWFTSVMRTGLLDARLAIAVLNSLTYSGSALESLTGCPSPEDRAYAQAIQGLRTDWFGQLSIHQRGDALRDVFCWAENRIIEMIERTDQFLVGSGWLQLESQPGYTGQASLVPGYEVRVVFQPEPSREEQNTLSFPASFLRVFALYGQAAAPLAQALTVKLPSSLLNRTTPGDPFEHYLCRRARDIAVQTSFLMKHHFWFGSFLPGQLLRLPAHER